MTITEQARIRTNENVKRNLLNAIRTMRDALDSAERSVNYYTEKTDPNLAAGTCLHVFNWGYANSISSIETGLSYLEEFNGVMANAKAVTALQAIAALGGNLSDDRLTDKTGPNDAAHRGLMYTEARRLAREVLGVTG